MVDEAILYGIVESISLENSGGESLGDFKNITIVDETEIEEVLCNYGIRDNTEVDKPEVYILTKVPVYKHTRVYEKSFPSFSLNKSIVGKEIVTDIGFKTDTKEKGIEKTKRKK